MGAGERRGLALASLATVALGAIAGCGGGGGHASGEGGRGGGGSGGAGGRAPGGSGGAGAGGGSTYPVLTVSGRKLYDTCGAPLVIRGVEMPLGLGFEVNGSLANAVVELAKTGANAVRLLPDVSQLSAADLGPVVAAAVQAGLVVFISPGDTTWFGRADAQALIAEYEPYIVLDAFQEAAYDNPTMWLSDAKAAVATVRGYGYRVPLTAISNQYGRDLPTALSKGAQVVAADSLGNTIIGWQAYWGSSNYYQGLYGLTLDQAMQQVASAAFTIQIGLDDHTDYATDPIETLDYPTLMNDAKTYGVGWLWWDWRLIGSDHSNDLSTDGTFAHLSGFGADVISGQPAGLAKTAVKACRPAGF